MRKGEDIRAHTADEIRATRRRGEDRTDWAQVDAMTEADLWLPDSYRSTKGIDFHEGL